ncbi:hypothetical protein [uncultured Lamprocystis sp.]|jgi:hypothetical protein|uniref:choice-of-anchor Y domain-containing protein n=1 Tax=uncultured Lamprocystis sp. TaxID=543132 RepID=UPI0025F138B5|nr:hypothetical protein [uncultured Lamprocystis sp.]
MKTETVPSIDTRRLLRHWLTCASGATWLLCCALTHAGPIYDGALGTSPGAQGWIAFVPSASESVAAGAVTLDTTADTIAQAGYMYSLPIDSGAGFTLSFTTQLLAESHTGNSNRAGFSVILLDDAHQGIELGFWTDQVWAQAVGFTKAETAAFDTTAMTDYLLRLDSGSYALWANGSALLSGAMRDYSAFGFPYTLPNFLFLGDDTTSALARVRIAEVGVVVPEPPAWALLFGGLLLLARPTWTSRSSFHPTEAASP